MPEIDKRIFRSIESGKAASLCASPDIPFLVFENSFYPINTNTLLIARLMKIANKLFSLWIKAIKSIFCSKPQIALTIFRDLIDIVMAYAI